MALSCQAVALMGRPVLLGVRTRPQSLYVLIILSMTPFETIYSFCNISLRLTLKFSLHNLTRFIRRILSTVCLLVIMNQDTVFTNDVTHVVLALNSGNPGTKVCFESYFEKCPLVLNVNYSLIELKLPSYIHK